MDVVLMYPCSSVGAQRSFEVELQRSSRTPVRFNPRRALTRSAAKDNIRPRASETAVVVTFIRPATDIACDVLLADSLE